MLRRRFLIIGAGAGFALAQKKPDDTVIAGATEDTTARVAIVLSSFKQGEDHDGTKIPGLRDPRPPDADLTSTQLDALVRKAIDLAALRDTQFAEVVEPDDWVVIKTHIPPGGVPAATTDPRIVGSVISYLAERKRGLRFTVVERLPDAGAWNADYRKLIGELTSKFPDVRFELADLNSAPTLDLPVPRKPDATYTIPKIVQQCDRFISIAPLATDAGTGVSLSIKNYMRIPSKAGATDEAMIDVFSYRPADFALVGGCWGTEGDGTPIHHNVVIAGLKAVAVDSVATAVMGFKPADLPFLALFDKHGFGTRDIDEIWIRGNQIDEARKEFKKPTGWRK